MAAAVQQPLSANLQHPFHYPDYPTSSLIMPNDDPSTPLVKSNSLADLSQQSPRDTLNLVQASFSQTSLPSLKKRRASKGKVPPEIKRSTSTPHMRSLAALDGESLSPTTDKKRNKLGYHRTSVACGHCRRRKIRCLPAPDDVHGRCSNCIRLKKECNFYPVDQEAQHKSSAAGSKAPTASNPSSPRTIATPSRESVEDFNSYQSVPSSASNSRFVLSSDHEGSTTSSCGSGMIFQQPIALPPHVNPYADNIEDQWSPGYYGNPLGGEGRFDSHTAPAYWRPHDPESAPAYGHESKPVAGYSQPRIGSVSSLAYSTADDTQNWTLPARSLSFGTLPPQYSHQQHDYADRPAMQQYSHPPALDTSVAIASNSGPAPLSAPIAGHGVSGYGYPQAWNANMYRAPASGSDAPLQGPTFTQHYYAEPGSLQQIKEEHAVGASQYAGTPNYYQSPDHVMR